MTIPKTKEGILQQMRFTWLGIAASIPLYVWVSEMMPGISWLDFPRAGKTFVTLGILSLLLALWFWRNRYSPALRLVRSQPQDVGSFRRWMATWIVLLSLGSSEAVFGLAFRMGHKTLDQCLPFYAFAAVLILYVWPRQSWIADIPQS
jgi:hypothetical protein